MEPGVRVPDSWILMAPLKDEHQTDAAPGRSPPEILHGSAAGRVEAAEVVASRLESMPLETGPPVAW